MSREPETVYINSNTWNRHFNEFELLDFLYKYLAPKHLPLYGWLCARFADAPEAQVREEVFSHWEYLSSYGNTDECKCAKCGQHMTTAAGERMNFCPNCGATMRPKKEVKNAR